MDIKQQKKILDEIWPLSIGKSFFWNHWGIYNDVTSSQALEFYLSAVNYGFVRNNRWRFFIWLKNEIENYWRIRKNCELSWFYYVNRHVKWKDINFYIGERSNPHYQNHYVAHGQITSLNKKSWKIQLWRYVSSLTNRSRIYTKSLS